MRIESQDLGIDYRDSGPWRNYELSTDGKTIEECIDNASISEIDQDGGELATYGYEEASHEVAFAVCGVVTKAFKSKGKVSV